MPRWKRIRRGNIHGSAFCAIYSIWSWGRDASRRVPPASVQLQSRTAETYYEMVVMVQQGQQEQRKYTFPVPIARYDTLSTFGMYNRPESANGYRIIWSHWPSPYRGGHTVPWIP